MNKDFSKNSPLSNLSGAGSQKTQTPEPVVTSGAGAAVSSDQPKRKPGRPKKNVEDTRNINIAMPVSLYEKAELAVKFCGGSMTEYINSLIKADIDKNYQLYENLETQLSQRKI